jgi:Ala-tRNA(Pro) deacylase
MSPIAEAPATDGLARTIAFLDAEHVERAVIAHAPALTACDAARLSYQPCETVAKAVVLCDHDRYAIAALPASERLDLRKARAALGAGRRLRLATEAEIAAAFPGFAVGALPPLGRLLKVPVLVDRRLLTYNHVLCASGDHGHSVRLDPADLLRLDHPSVADLSATAHR